MSKGRVLKYAIIFLIIGILIFLYVSNPETSSYFRAFVALVSLRLVVYCISDAFHAGQENVRTQQINAIRTAVAQTNPTDVYLTSGTCHIEYYIASNRHMWIRYRSDNPTTTTPHPSGEKS